MNPPEKTEAVADVHGRNLDYDFPPIKLKTSEKPRRTMDRVCQLLLGQIAPEKCTTQCSDCGTDQIHARNVASTTAQSAAPKTDAITVPAGFPGKTAAAQEKQLETRRKSAIYRNGAISRCSPMKKRSWGAIGDQDDPDDVKHQTKYRASLYRSTAVGTSYRSTGPPGKRPSAPQGGKPAVFQYWRIMHAKPSGRKNKIWEDDGTLAIEASGYVVRGSDGGELARRKGAVTPNEVQALTEGKIMLIGGKEIQLLEGISKTDYQSGAYLL